MEARKGEKPKALRNRVYDTMYIYIRTGRERQEMRVVR
jgi:hypothetical protein